MSCECYPYISVDCEQGNIFIDIITGPQSGTSAQIIERDQDDLTMDLNGNYYLEFVNDAGIEFSEDTVPVVLRIDGVSQPGLVLDQNFVPYRLYGFSNNTTQTIKITVI